MWESADVGNGAVGDKHLLVVKIDGLDEPQSNFLDTTGDNDGAGNLRRNPRFLVV